MRKFYVRRKVQEVRPKGIGFLSIDDLVEDQGELALTIEYDSTTQTTLIEACAPLADDTTQGDIAAAYVSLCDSASPSFSSLFLSSTSASISPINCNTNLDWYLYISFENVKTPLAIFAGKKYKPVALKVRPVETELVMIRTYTTDFIYFYVY